MSLGQNPISRKTNIVVQELEDEILIYDLAKNKALCLNETSKLIWQECDGTKSVTEISQKLSHKFKSPISEDFVWLALQQFKKDELLEENLEFVTPLEGLNRREIVKRIGFASMIALPVVASVLAPTAINAQSTTCGCGAGVNLMGRDAGCPCVGSADCCNGLCSAGGMICGAANPSVGPACCPGGIVCPPANGVGIPPGCSCNDNTNCAGGMCVGNVCALQ